MSDTQAIQANPNDIPANPASESMYVRGGVEYDMNSDQVAKHLGKSVEWVRIHAADLGGVKAKWADGYRLSTWL